MPYSPGRHTDRALLRYSNTTTGQIRTYAELAKYRMAADRQVAQWGTAQGLQLHNMLSTVAQLQPTAIPLTSALVLVAEAGILSVALEYQARLL